jgi:prepilin-type N-terminal cleavage/methylation domain-containing protein
MNKGFTMLEMLLAVLMVGVLTVFSFMTFNAVTRGWQVSTEYLDKQQRTDYALGQVVSGLRSMYYPHNGEQDDRYGFVLTDNGDGQNPDDSDVIEWSKMGPAIIGNKSALADSVHRVQVMVLEEGNTDWLEEIKVTGLYARVCPDAALAPEDEDVDDDGGFTFANEELYQPVLIADGVEGFNCRVLKNADKIEGGENDRRQFEDEFSESNSVPYKVELTFFIADPEGRSYRTDTAPMMRIVRIPIHEQSRDGSVTPDAEGDGAAGGGKVTGGGKGGGAGGAAGGAGGGKGGASGPGGGARL